jgi:hypothetical protein
MSNQHIEALNAARERLVENRRGFVQALAKPYEREKTEDMRDKFLKVQETIAAIDEALKDEKNLNPDVSPAIAPP